MMKIIAFVIASSMIYSAHAAASQQCRNEFAKGTKCYINKADGIVHKRSLDIDVDALERCINNRSKQCGSSISRELGSDYSEVPPDTLERCAEETMDSAQDQIQACLKKTYPSLDFGTKREQKNSPGLKLIILYGTMKQAVKTCPAVRDCVSDSYPDIKKELCAAEDECFARNFDRRCPNMEDDVQQTTCSCYKAIPNKQNIATEFDQCCGIQQRNLLGFVANRAGKSVLLKTVEQKVCEGKDYTSAYGICDGKDELIEKPGGSLLRGLLSGGNSNAGSSGNSGGGGSRFGNFGNLGSLFSGGGSPWGR